MPANVDLTRFLQRRDLLAYEQRLARSAYAYGVDLRRATWVHSSRIGDPLMRGVDRRWNATTRELSDELAPADEILPTQILEELANLIRLLRAPMPSVRVLRPEAKDTWPLATPLGTTRGGIHWLVLDLPRLLACTEAERTFVLGWALGHLQCDHGPLFAAHLMAHRARRSLGMVGLVFKPWARVAAFSADRAGMLAVGSLDKALEGLPLVGGRDVAWLPAGPTLEERRRALEDFDRSTIMVRRRVLTEAGRQQWTLGTPKTASLGLLTERLSHVFGAAARLGNQAVQLIGGDSASKDKSDGEGKGAANGASAAGSGSGSATAGSGTSGAAGSASSSAAAGSANAAATGGGASSVAGSSSASGSAASSRPGSAVGSEADDDDAMSDGDPDRDREETTDLPPGARAANDPTADPLQDIPELAARLDKALADAWSIARIDQILTRKLRLL